MAEANCVVLCLDEKGRITYINPFGLTFFGFSESEIVDRFVGETIFPRKPDGADDPAAMIDALLTGQLQTSHHIIENRRKNGDPVWVVWSNRAFHDSTHRLTHILCVGNDITDRKTFERVLEEARVQLTTTVQEQNTRLQEANARLQREIDEREKAQTALKESRDRYRLFSTVSTEGILFHDNGMAIEVNDAFTQIVECPREHLIGRDMISRFVTPGDQQQVRQKMASAGNHVYEIKIRTSSGKIIPVELRSRPGELAGRLCRVVSVRDITHRKKTERQLIQSQKMEAVGTLAGGIAHDFNNMLAGIQGNVEILRHQLSPNSPHQRRLSIISQIVERGAKLSGQLLGYARGGQTEISKINLNRLVEESLDMFGHAHRQINIEIRLDPQTPTIHGDRTQIEQVLLNLMINAVHAMPSGGCLRIETCATILEDHADRAYEVVPGPYAMLSVQDTGHGMDPETQKQIFEPFFTTKAEGEGTGLGLASTYGIVKNHKGYIDVFSRPGEGSRFNVFLPAAVSEEIGQVDPPPAPQPQKATETILLVDDEPDFLDVGREILILLGYQVVAAISREVALDRLKENRGRIALVIMDMIMPGIGAEAAIRQLRDLDPSLPVLLASGYSQDGKVGRELMQLCQGFIQKPFRLAELSRTIREILQGACTG